MGTPAFAVPALCALAASCDVRLVITQPDRPSGRGRALAASPVKAMALQLGLPVLQPEIVKGKRFAEKMAALHPDYIVTAAYGRILGPSLLRVPQRACLNVHASILPAYRGAAPVNHAILNGETEAGVSIMQMVTELDAGPVYRVAKTQIGEQETAGELLTRLAQLGADALMEVLQDFGAHTPQVQDDSRATFAPMLQKSDGIIDWSKRAIEIHNHIRAMTPWPGATTLWQGQAVKIGAATVATNDVSATSNTPGTVLQMDERGIEVACGRGALRLLAVQFPGKKMLHVSQFIHATPLQQGACFSADSAHR